MTVSAQSREANRDAALKWMFSTLAGRPIDLVFFDPAEAADILATTWEELREYRLLKRSDVDGKRKYRLTGEGWYTALEVTGVLNSPETDHSMQALAAALKKFVEGRSVEVVVPLDAVAQQAGIAPGWIFNAIEAKLFFKSHNRFDAKWYSEEPGSEERGRLVCIPITFGLIISTSYSPQINDVTRTYTI